MADPTSVARALRAIRIDFSAEALIVVLADGRSLSVPLAWLPRLRDASGDERRAWELIDNGEEIRWPALAEDRSVAGLLGLQD